MIRGARFWISITVFQVAFGLAVFFATRQYYISDSDPVGFDPVVLPQSLPVWPDPIAETGLTQPEWSMPGELTGEDPVQLSRQADEYFASKQYNKAADLYERALALNPNNVDTYNNLGLTLHYLGRSTEALSRLNEGVALNPTHQRIWLTLGFVNSQLGNIEQARAALGTAAQMETDSEIGRSARKMLENLP